MIYVGGYWMDVLTFAHRFIYKLGKSATGVYQSELIQVSIVLHARTRFYLHRDIVVQRVCVSCLQVRLVSGQQLYFCRYRRSSPRHTFLHGTTIL